MRLVWSQSVSTHGRPRQVLLTAVLCVFLGFVLGGSSDLPRPFRAAAASLLTTGGLFLLAGIAGLAWQKGRRSSSPLSLASPIDSAANPESASGLQEEEQR